MIADLFQALLLIFLGVVGLIGAVVWPRLLRESRRREQKWQALAHEALEVSDKWEAIANNALARVSRDDEAKAAAEVSR